MIPAQDAVEYALAAASGAAEHTVVIVTDRAEASLRWAGNSMTTNGVSTSRSTAVISFVRRGQTFRVGAMRSSTVDPDAIAALVAASERAARAAPLRPVRRAAEHREILGRAEIRPEGGKLPAAVRLELVVLGQARVVEARATNWAVAADRVSVDLDFPVSLDAWGIERPSFLMFIRVGDEVRVRVRVELTRA